MEINTKTNNAHFEHIVRIRVAVNRAIKEAEIVHGQVLLNDELRSYWKKQIAEFQETDKWLSEILKGA